MKRSLVAWMVAAVAALGGGAFAYVFWFAGGNGEPTTELTTPELGVTPTVLSGSGDSVSTIPSTETTTVGSASRVFVIDQTQSTPRFEIDEVLNGSPKHVIGATDHVVGQFQVDDGDLSSIEFSEIIVNARTLTTDSERRDRAMRGPVILNSGSDEHELITYMITSVHGLTGEASNGSGVEFTITGDLTIKGITQPVTFDVTVAKVDDDTIEGSAVANITRDMFAIGIPSVPSVADVANEVLVALEFLAISS